MQRLLDGRNNFLYMYIWHTNTLAIDLETHLIGMHVASIWEHIGGTHWLGQRIAQQFDTEPTNYVHK